MRIPTEWNDRSLLDDEPFLSYFAARRLQDARGRNTNAQVTSAICSELKKADGWREAVQEWLRMAFTGPAGKGASKKVIACKTTIKIFVEFYWKLSQEEKQALTFLNEERKNRNCHYFISGPRQPVVNPEQRVSKMNDWGCSHSRKTKRTQDSNPEPDSISVRPKEEVLPSSAVVEAPPALYLESSDDVGQSSQKIQRKAATLPGHSRKNKIRKANASTSIDHAQTSADNASNASDTVALPMSGESPTGRWASAHALPRSDVPILPNSLKRSTSKRSSKLSKRGAIANETHPISEMKQEPIEIECSPSKRQRTDPELTLGDVDTSSGKPKGRKRNRGPGLSKAVRSSQRNESLNSSTNQPLATLTAISAIEDVKPSRLSFIDPFSEAELPVSVGVIQEPHPIFQDAPQTANLSIAPVTSSGLRPSIPAPSRYIPQPVVPYVPVHPVSFPGIPLKDEEFSRNWLSNLTTSYDDPSEIDEDEEKEVLKLLDSELMLPDIGIPACKEPLPLYPPIWAQSRQEVCESFDWFRSYQGGVYFSRNVVKGYLLSAFSARRDRFDDGGRLIISHGGGRAESIHRCKGESSTQQAEDQLAHDKSVRALLTNYQERRPVVLIIDDKYTLFPYDLGAKGITYAVLGFYTIARAWAEFQPANNERGRVVRYKFAFQWCEGQGDPWWIPKDDGAVNGRIRFSYGVRSSELVSRSMAEFLPVKVEEHDLEDLLPTLPREICEVCPQCHHQSPQVYLQNWACLNPTCILFWTSPDGQQLPDKLDYNPKFLQLPPPVPLPIGYELLPSLPVPENSDGITTNYAFSRGWHCKKCGRLSCRFKWMHWECMHCQATYKIPGKIRLAKEFWLVTVPVAFRDHLIVTSAKIHQLPLVTYSHERGVGQCQTFVLPYGRGRIHHIQSGSPLGKIEADNIFREYQEQAMSGELAFRRWPLRAHKCRGSLLTHYFSQNSGEPYQYVGGTANTVPFDKAPSAVVKARNLIQNRINQALGKSATFNEVLSAAYMERQKMAFHSDNETGLGPLVAGLSLGSPALMHFRLHAKHDPNKQHRGILMSFVLRHSDILVMDGAGVQEFYEHTVIPANFRIAATARFINPNHNVR